MSDERKCTICGYAPANYTEVGIGPVCGWKHIRVEHEGPIAMRLHCPSCGELHIDEGEFATKEHHTHACQYCGMVWRPALVATVGVRFLPGFKNAPHNLSGGEK